MIDFDFIKREIEKDWRIALYSGLLKIKNKEGKLIKFIPNKAQEKVINKIWELEQENRPVRIVIPKARQHGITTLIDAIIYIKTAFCPDKNALIMAQLKENASEIFAKTQIMHDMLISELRPMTFKSNAKEIKFRNRSNIYVKSAESKQGGRTYTFQYALFSEIAFYNNPTELMTGTLQTIADIPGTMIIFESTGNGIGGYFYDICKNAELKKNIYDLIFLSWFENPDYSMKLQNEFVPLSEGRYGDENFYITTYNLTNEQMNWRRYQIDNKMQGDLMMFMQEYPANIDECFIASGLPVFDLIKLNEIEKIYSQQPLKTGFIDNHKYIESVIGWFKTFKEYEAGYKDRYIVILDTGGHWEGADYSVALVWDRVLKEVSAIAHGHFDDYEFADYGVDICKMYGNAKLVIEINKWASETENNVSLLKDILSKIKYYNLYKRKKYDKISKVWTNEPGFHTNIQTKKMIVERLKRSINENENNKINDIEIIKEMKTYVIARSKTGKTQYQAQEGCKDDRVMCYGIALIIDEELPKAEKIETENTYNYNENDINTIY